MIKFYSEHPYLFIRHDSIGYRTANIHEYNTGIQFRNGVYETNCPNTIKALRNYIQGFLNKGIKPPVWEHGQVVEEQLKDIVEQKEKKIIHNITDHKTILNRLADSIKQ